MTINFTPTVGEVLKKYKGKTVRVRMNLVSHLSEPKDMLLVGPVLDGSLDLFIDSVREIAGTKVINGITCWQGHIRYEGFGGNAFIIDNNHEQYPSREIRELEAKDYQEAIRLWGAREK